MTAQLPELVRGTTKRFSVTISVDGAAPDIRSDTVTLTVKRNGELDATAVLQKNADVTTSGATGTAIFTLTNAETKAIAAGLYRADVAWIKANAEEYVLDIAPQFTVYERVSDVPA